jgi:hypothetical protein
VPPPATSALQSDRWALIDRTCQIMFAGDSPDAITFVFPTSTGEEGYRTAAFVSAYPASERFGMHHGFERFDTGVYHRDDFVVANDTWTGDHDLDCGPPDTRRTITAPNALDMGFSWHQEPNGKIWWVLVMGNSSAQAIIPDSNPSASRLVPLPAADPTDGAVEETPGIIEIASQALEG